MGMELIEWVPLDVSDAERSVLYDRVGQLHSDLTDAGFDVVVDVTITADGERFVFAIEDPSAVT
jgi:hypothetical protein